MALPPQPVDRVHPHVARVHPRWPSWSTSPHAAAAAARSGGRRASSLLPFGSWDIPPGAHPGVSSCLDASTTSDASCLVTVGSPVPRQRLQHRHPHPATELLGLGDRLGCFVSHCLQPWYDYRISILLFSFLHCCGKWRHSPGCWHRILHSSWPFPSQQCPYSS